MYSVTLREETINVVYDKFIQTHPELIVYYDEEKLEHIRQDTQYHIEQLEAAAMYKMDSIFLDYVEWVNGVLTARGIATSMLINCFVWMKEVLVKHTQTKEHTYYADLLTKGIHILTKSSTLK